MPKTPSHDRFFVQLLAFTKDVYDDQKIDFVGTGRNNYGPYSEGEPSGHVLHYTASPNGSIQRLRTFLKRFRIDSGTKKKPGVGIAFAVFDTLHPELEKVREKYPDLYGPNGLLRVDVLHWGLKLAFYSSNWANKFTCGTELRNVGKLYTKNGRTFYWGRAKNIGNRKYLYTGRPPVKIRGMWCEPFAEEQLLASEHVCRQLKKWETCNGDFEMANFMSHHLIHKNKWDAWPHYPFGRLKEAVCYDKPFNLDGYITELDQLRCPYIKDDDSAEKFLVAMGYLARGWWERTPPAEVEPTREQAIKYFQKKKGLRANGKLTNKTIKAMNATRRAYKLV